MKTINLTSLERSQIKYEIQSFPDGQQNLVITSFRECYGLQGDLEWDEFFDGSPIQIMSRLNNWRDLELIVCTVASLRELEVEEIHLYTPYILGARSDRKFQDGGNNYLRDVICPAINALGCKTVTCIDPHSDCLEMGIKGFRKESNERLVRWSLANIQQNKGNGQSTNLFTDCILASPDAGASKKIYKLAEQIGYKGDIITCDKARDVDGKLTWVNVPIKKEDLEKDIIIIDDICDGGATFNNISAALNDAGHQGKKYLIVTHGIFSKGFEELSKYFDGIYCTNSYSDLPNWKVEGNTVITANNNSSIPDFIKQLNVF